MPGIPPTLHTQLRNTLLDCDAIADPSQLRALFTTDDLRPFRDRIHIATSASGQVDLLLTDLLERRRATGESVLVLFLRRLAERYDSQDEMHGRLQELAKSVESALDPAYGDSTPVPAEALTYHEALRLLREALASLYPDSTSAQRIVEDAGIETRSIDFSGAATNRWRNILNEVEKYASGLQRLIKVAQREYPVYPPLNDAAKMLASAPKAASPPINTPELSAAPDSRGRADGQNDTAPVEIKRRFALLVGVRDYADARYQPLPRTLSDVSELEKVLSAAGYTVRMLHSDQTDERLRPTRDNIWGELGNLAQQTGAGDLLLVHFAGHGDLYNGKAYLIASQTRNAALQHTAIDLDAFKSELCTAPAQARILFLDACHSGTGRDGSGMDPDFERHVIRESSGLAILASCRQRQVAYEHNESTHGVFTHFILQGLQGNALVAGQRFVTFTGLNHYVTDQVTRWAISQGLQQTPNASTELVGDPPILEIKMAKSRAPQPLPANPFAETLAIRDPARFIGRSKELARIESMLASGSVALLGEPKIGKSSLLWQLARSWQGEVIGPIDCHGLESMDDFYAELAKRLALPNGEWRTLRAALNERPGLLLFDEFDSSPDWGMNSEQLRRFRALCDHNRQLHLVTTARKPLKEIFPDGGRGSPAYNFLIPLTLGNLNEAEARQLLAHPWTASSAAFDEPAYSALLAMAGTHPFRLQRAAFHCYQQLADTDYAWQTAYQQDMEHLQ